MAGQTLADIAREEKSKLRQAMGFRDLVLFYFACVVTMRTVAMATEVGPSIMVLWVLGFVTFYVPQALAVIELNARHPEEGGIYVWVQHAFGDFHAFITAWFYWTANLVYFPAVLLFAASNAALVIPGQHHLGDSTLFLTGFSLVALAVAVALNVRGLDIAKLLHNAAGVFNLWVPGVVIIVIGLVTWAHFGAATEFSVRTVVPKLGGFADLMLLAAIAYSYSGLESASLMGEEIKDAQRSIPRALITAGVFMLVMFILISIGMLVALPAEQISALTGITDAVATAGLMVGGPWLGQVLMSLLGLAFCIGATGTVSAWMAACARLPFVAGLDRYLPKSFGDLHPRYHTPHVAIITLGVATGSLILLGSFGGGVGQVYRIFVSLEITVYFITFLYMFGALLALQREGVGSSIQRVPWAPMGAYLAGGVGFAVTLVSLIFALIPGEAVEDRMFFYYSVFGTLAANTLLGIGFYAFGTIRRRRAEQVLAASPLNRRVTSR